MQSVSGDGSVVAHAYTLVVGSLFERQASLKVILR